MDLHRSNPWFSRVKCTLNTVTDNKTYQSHSTKSFTVFKQETWYMILSSTPHIRSYTATSNIHTLKKENSKESGLNDKSVLGTSHLLHDRTTPTIWDHYYPSLLYTEKLKFKETKKSAPAIEELRGIYRSNSKDSTFSSIPHCLPFQIPITQTPWRVQTH